MAVAPELAGLAAFAACLILLGTLFAYQNTIGALTRVLASLFLVVSIPVPFSSSIHPLKFIADGITAVDNGIRASLLAGIEGTKWAYTNLFHLTAYAVQEVGAALHGLAADTENALGILTRHKIAALIATALIDPLALLGLNAAGLVKLEHALVAVEGRLGRYVANAQEAAERAEVGLAHAIAVDLPALRRRALDDAEAIVRPIGDEVSALGKRLGRVASRLNPLALTGVVAFALARLGIGWARCSNVQRVGKQMCGLDHDLLESILADTALILGTISLVEFAEGMKPIVAELVPDVARFWRADIGG